MPAATAATFTGIHNENEFYSHHYQPVAKVADSAWPRRGRTP